MAFRDFVARTEDVPVGLLVRRRLPHDPGDEVIAAYEAPFPNARVQGRRARVSADPAHVALDAGAAAGQRVLDALRVDAAAEAVHVG